MDSRRQEFGRVDRAIATLITFIVVGAVLAFGGQVWWIHLYLAATSSLLLVALAVRACFLGSVSLLRSPLGLLAALILALATIQLVPLPGGLVDGVSGRGAELRRSGDLDETRTARATLTTDRSATVRWLGGAAACAVLFWSVAHYTDRVGRLRLVCGSIVAAFGVCTILTILQLVGEAKGTYGAWIPGRSPVYAPSLADVLAGPGETRLATWHPEKSGQEVWALSEPIVPAAAGPLVAGPGGFLALAALALPLSLGLFLHRVAPRGSREPTRSRLRHHGGLAPVFLLGCVGLFGSALVGYFGGGLVVLAVATGLVLTAGAGFLGTGHARLSLLSLAACVACLMAGHALSRSGEPRSARTDVSVWGDAIRVIRAFPLFGVGMGSFPAAEAHFKLEDVGSRTARSSVLQWWAEGGTAGMVIVAAGLVWALSRIPHAWRSVGSADRNLAGALLGACLGFGLFSVVHWSVQLLAVALCAAAVLGLANRWLAGGTDLFVEAT